MRLPTWVRQHLAAVRALLVLTVITGILYPLAVWGIAFVPGLHGRAEGSMIKADGRVVGSAAPLETVPQQHTFCRAFEMLAV